MPSFPDTIEADRKNLPRCAIWVVDDHPITRLACEVVLRQAPLQVSYRAFETPVEVKQALTSEQPDILIVDLLYPRDTGYSLLEWIRDTYPAVRLIVYSAKEEAHYAEHCLKCGACAFVSKGSASEELLRAVQAAISGGVHLAYPGHGGTVSPIDSPTRLSDLSKREIEVLHLIGVGMDTQSIARRLCRSPKTIETYRHRIRKKLGLVNQIQLTQLAWQYCHEY